MDISQEFISKVMLGIKYDTKKTLSENKKLISEDTNQCKNEWYYFLEEEGSNESKNNGNRLCWDGKDPLSCQLRKFVGKESNLSIEFCRNLDPAIPCSESLSYANACAIGKTGNKVNNPYINNDSLKRHEGIYLDPISPNNTNIQVEVFRERKELIDLMDVLLGKSNKKLSGGKGDYAVMLGGYRQGCIDGTYYWRVNNASDNLVMTVIDSLKNQTSIPFGDVSEGETNVQYDENGTGKPTQTISSKIINTINPETGEKYNFKEVQSSFGVKTYNKKESKDSNTNKENFNDNLKLQKAWDSGWRPNNGMDVPENLQTNTYKNNSSNDSGNTSDTNGSDGDNSSGDNENKGSSEGTNDTNLPSSDSTPTTVDIIDVNKSPKFPGGNESWDTWFNDNFVYPEKAINSNIQGTVTASFEVSADGSISNIKIVNGVNRILDDEVIKLIKKMPKWEPANEDGKNITSIVTLPVIFSL